MPHAAANPSPATRQLAQTTVGPNRTIALTYSLEQPVQKRFAFETGVDGDLSESGVQRADLQWIVRRDRDVMFVRLLRRQANVAAALMIDRVPQPSQSLG